LIEIKNDNKNDLKKMIHLNDIYLEIYLLKK